MKITVMGTGYVGLVAGTCLANLGNDVFCVDVDEKKISDLNKGILPIFEPGLRDLVDINTKEGRLKFTTDAKTAIESSQVVFSAVGTPPDKDHRADLKYVFQVAESVGKYMKDYVVVVDKSTVPVGTAEKVKAIIKKSQPKPMPFDVVSNPEFLREGEAIKDFTNPDRIVVGLESERAKEIMYAIYKGIERTGKPILFTDIKTAELIKYASNAMLATRISFMNELSHLCEKTGADVKMVAKGMGLDSRIGPRFLQAGVGYGGSCFPKDVNALVQTLKEHGCSSDIVDAVERVNERQKKSLVPKITALFDGDLNGKIIAVWGLAFKPKTDDMREAPAIVIINELQKLGAKIVAFDPVAREKAELILKNMDYRSNPYETIKNADALVIMTEWDEFRHLDLNAVKTLLKKPNIVDGRNVYELEEMKKLGFNYVSVGRAAVFAGGKQ
ncbi:UDP-glucose/GDP-mannose dehydrogenase family protein [Candidatus Woesearchaeota archaeon]|nr:UDP-glucose/GDP-mannose dehydrogenase family protein [Candidatus Woesearchaeota archaeon]